MHYQEQMESLMLGEERRRGNYVRDADADADADEGANSQSSFPNSPDDSDRRSSSSSSSRRGLSKYYKGKSQSFTSLAEALTVEDLAKPENPFNAKLKQRRESPHCRRLSGCGGASERNLSGHDVFLDRPPRLSGNRPPLRAQTLSAAHISALLTRT
ncbi:hypothetical protein CARUB_v10014819mg [Capsella rubella]|uniref:Uncharacterized protein n=1 Tax=Capsella rubella TaxID=81985 RepID=R0G806_9BRAS|nr:uncharacterized protein LOC17892543 [Capsella rubella]EOA31621.1 hypothetical protein CARUB_v10014819mg [Capsella rubella]